MAIRAAFIGLDKHLDPDVRELTGARRDATALWALFSDSVPEIDARLLVDADATLEAIRQNLDDTLARATEDDVVIFSFSGHGTRDHRLVTYNTSLSSLTPTTLGMDELATKFRLSKAKAILLILDCCFSGGAPARVLDSSPVPRDAHNPLVDIGGRGRILISASGINEPAWEAPGTSHGLLTKALLDALTGEAGDVEMIACMAKVMERVQADASRLGVVQTPVLFGHIEGGLVFPKLHRGARFLAAFPETGGARIGAPIDELSVFGLPASIIAAWKDKYPDGLNSLQLAAVNDHRVLDGDSALVVAPTSSGKTFIGELAAARAVTQGRKAVFLLPYRALVNEKYEQFDETYRAAGVRVIRCTGDYSDQVSTLMRGKYDLGILTYEMFLNLVIGNPHLLNQLGLVVLDEGQFITDPNRGITVELLLTFLVAARTRGIAPQLLVLSAVIGDINHFDEWLGVRSLVSTQRPVPLTEGVLDRNGTFQFMSPSGEVKSEQLLSPHQIRVRKKDASAQDVIVPLVANLVSKGEKVIVFRNRRGPAEGCAQYLAADLGMPAAVAALAELPNHDLSSTSARLRKCLEGGTAFHNTNLTREEKSIVERHYRARDGGIAVLAATTTVAAGINTPASTVLLAEQEFVGDDGRAFTVAEYKNMAGRAGRLGYNEVGRSIVYAETPIDRDRLFRKYVLGKPEPMASSFSSEHLSTWIVRLLAQVPRISRADVATLLANTYGGYLAGRRSSAWKAQTTRSIEELLARMLSLGLLETEGEFVRLTLLGRACGNSSLSFDSAIRLVELLRVVQRTTLVPEHLMAILQVLPESDYGYTPLMKKGRSEAERPRQASERYGSEITHLLQRNTADEFDYWKRCKRAAILWDWIAGISLDQIEKRYSPNPFQGIITQGDIRKFADATRFHLRAAHQIMSVLFIEHGPSGEAIERLLLQLELGIPESLLDLRRLPVPLARGEYLALGAQGLTTVDAVGRATLAQLTAILGERRAEELAGDADPSAEAA